MLLGASTVHYSPKQVSPTPYLPKPRKKDCKQKAVPTNKNGFFEAELEAQNLNIFKIANEFNKKMGGSNKPNDHVDFFTSKNFKNLKEITKVGCQCLIVYDNYVAMLQNL